MVISKWFRPWVEEFEPRLLLAGFGIWPIGLDPNTQQPYANDHQMLGGFGDGSPGNVFGFHEGIDIYLDGQGGQVVQAARDGQLFM